MRAVLEESSGRTFYWTTCIWVMCSSLCENLVSVPKEGRGFIEANTLNRLLQVVLE